MDNQIDHNLLPLLPSSKPHATVYIHLLSEHYSKFYPRASNKANNLPIGNLKAERIGKHGCTLNGNSSNNMRTNTPLVPHVHCLPTQIVLTCCGHIILKMMAHTRQDVYATVNPATRILSYLGTRTPKR